MLFHKYCNIFGKPNEGVHKIRFFGMGLVDLLATLLLAIFVKFVFRDKFKDDSIFVLFFILFIVGQVFHFLFGVNTAFMKFIGFKFPQC